MLTRAHLDRNRLTLLAMAAAILLFATLAVREGVLWYLGMTDGLAAEEGLRRTRLVAFAVVTLMGLVALALAWRRRELGTRITVFLLTLSLPFVFAPAAFQDMVPQGFWIPFLLALAVSGLRWALATLGFSVLLTLMAYPAAWRNPGVILTSLIVFVLLMSARLIQQELLEKEERARRKAQNVEHSLRQSEARHRQLVEESPLAIQSLAPDGTIVRVNEAWRRLWGIELEQLTGYTVFRDRQLAEKGVLPLLEKAFGGERVELPVVEYDLARAPALAGQDRRLWVRTIAYPVRDGDGRVQEVVLVQEDVTERVQHEAQIRDLAFFDALTQLPNRRLLMDRLGQSLIASARSREFGALLILDLDNFKALNDSQGHDIGDQLLVEVARRLRETVRHEDTVARLGGDEFVVILEGMAVTESAAAAHVEFIAEKVRSALIEPYELEVNERTYSYYGTTSLGVTLFHGESVVPEILLKQADVALYQAKGAGRNAIRFFNSQMQAAIDSRTSMEIALRAALEKHEFELHYQPQVDVAGGVIGVEALLRWRSPARGLVSPGEFIPLAEDTGLILPIGRWVMETACAQLSRWQESERTRALTISVNVSARQVLQPDFVDQVQRCLQTRGVQPQRLKLELTESVVLEDLEGVIGKLRRLADLGIIFALDDFGTGYSSLSYLKRLPLRQLKIDQTFVRDIDVDPNDAAIVRAILAMSHSLGLEVIAEGVETATQMEFLKSNGCGAFQGFLFARPMPIDDVEVLLQKN